MNPLLVVPTTDPSSPPPAVSNYGWAGSIAAFLATSEPMWLTQLRAHHASSIRLDLTAAQVHAWQECFAVLQRELSQLLDYRPEAEAWQLIFEYELPRERGRRPDVVVLTSGAIVVLEFKQASVPRQAHLDQVATYARDLRAYHAASRDYPVSPLLVLTKAHGLHDQREAVDIISGDALAAPLAAMAPPPTEAPPDLTRWLEAAYEPLPALVRAARLIFQHEPLPQITRVQSAGIPETVALLRKIAAEAETRQEQHLAIVAGVPGSGKTLVGLQLVHEYGSDTSARPAVFLSRNVPLVKVLQDALKSSVFVQDVYGFLKQYGGSRSRVPSEHVWVYDEAQRAWDASEAERKRGYYASEPEDFLRIAERMTDGVLLVVLYGEGQEIYYGEEEGLALWNTAIARSLRPWIVHCPNRLAPIFRAAKAMREIYSFDLTTSLRSHLAEDVHLWVQQLLDGQLDDASWTADRLRRQGFAMYLTWDLDEAKQYVRERYAEDPSKRFGLIASSKARNVQWWGVRTDYASTKKLRVASWYNAPPNSPASCCQLQDVATEFAVQGLELDFPIIAWGDDLDWSDAAWRYHTSTSRAKDDRRLRLNSYRVLLTRGRDGFIIWLPRQLDPWGRRPTTSTYEALVRAGVSPLQSEGPGRSNPSASMSPSTTIRQEDLSMTTSDYEAKMRSLDSKLVELHRKHDHDALRSAAQRITQISATTLVPDEVLEQVQRAAARFNAALRELQRRDEEAKNYTVEDI